MTTAKKTTTRKTAVRKAAKKVVSEAAAKSQEQDRLVAGYVVGFDQKGQPRFQLLGQESGLLNGITVRGLHSFAGEEVLAITDQRTGENRVLLKQVAALLVNLGKEIVQEDEGANG